jgi:COP9 signalosome complex subunit 2
MLRLPVRCERTLLVFLTAPSHRFLVVSNLLANSNIDPLNSREARAFKDDPEATALHGLRRALDALDVAQFESALRQEQAGILSEPSLLELCPELTRCVRERVLARIIEPYSRASLDRLATEIGVGKAEILPMCVRLISDGAIDARLDEEHGVLVVHRARSAPPRDSDRRLASIARLVASARSALSSVNA